MRAEVAGHSACRVVLADEARGARDKERHLSVVNLEKKKQEKQEMCETARVIQTVRYCHSGGLWPVSASCESHMGIDTEHC